MNVSIGDRPAWRPAQQDPPGPAPGGRREHTVGQGETVGDLARHYRVSSSAIIGANPQAAIDPHRPLVQGDVLQIPDAPRLVMHEVAPGETVESIAARALVDPAIVRVDNGLAEGGQVSAGDVLWVAPGLLANAAGPFGPGALDARQAERAVIDITRGFDVYDADADGVVTEAELQYVVDHPDEFGGVNDPLVLAAAAAFAPVQVGLLSDPFDFTSVTLPVSWRSGERVFDTLASGEPGAEDHGIARQDAVLLLVAAPLPQGLDAEAAAGFASDQAAALVVAANAGWMPRGEALAQLDALVGTTQWSPESAVELVGDLSDAGISPERLVGLLDQATQGMTPEQLDAVLTEVQPRLEQAAQVRHQDRGDDRRQHERDYEYGAVATFYAGLASLYGRAGDAGRNAVVQALVPTIPDGDLEGIDDAAAQLLQSPEHWAFFAELVSELEFAGKTRAVQDLLGVIGDEQLVGPAEGAVAEYADLTEQYYFALQMRPLFADDASFEEAMDVLMTEALGDDWSAQVDQAQAALVAEGRTLLLRLDQFGHDPDIVALIANDPNAQFAISMALAADPALIRGEAGVRLLEVFAANGVVGADNPLAAIAVDAYLRVNVHQPLTDPSLAPDARAGLVEQAMDHDVLARVLGADSDAYAALVADLSRLAAGEGVDVDAGGSSLEASALFLETIDRIDGLGLSPDMNRLLKFGAFGVTALSTGESLDRFLDDPGAGTGFELLIDAADLGVSGAEVMRSHGLLGGRSALVNAGQRFLFVVGAGVSTLDAFERIGDGDWAGAGLNGVIAGGMVHAAFAGGPAGVGAAAVAQVVLIGYDGWRTAQHNNRFENDAQQAFLAASLLDDDTAAVLHDTSGGAVSPVPFLLRYSEFGGLSVEQSIAYLNSLSTEQLTLVRQASHHTLDELGGDPGAFAASDADDDAAFQAALDESGISPENVYEHAPAVDPSNGRDVDGNPVTAAQFDALLARIGIPTPAEWLAAGA